jgi:hypothetical protein
MTAAANGNISAFLALRDRGARLDRFDRDGKSIIYLVVEADHVPILKVKRACAGIYLEYKDFHPYKCTHRIKIIDHPTCVLRSTCARPYFQNIACEN